MRFISFLILMISCDVFSSDKIKLNNKFEMKDQHIEVSRLATSWRIGYSELTTAVSKNQSVFNMEIDTRYALFSKIGLNFSVNKWFANSSRINDSAGNLAIQTGLGFTFALNGSLIEKEFRSIFFRKKRIKKQGKTHLIYQKVTNHKKNDMDGFRLSFMATTVEFSKLESPVYGNNIALFYEQEVSKDLYFQYGIKSDSIKNRSVDFNIIQGFIGFTMIP